MSPVGISCGHLGNSDADSRFAFCRSPAAAASGKAPVRSGKDSRWGEAVENPTGTPDSKVPTDGFVSSRVPGALFDTQMVRWDDWHWRADPASSCAWQTAQQLACSQQASGSVVRKFLLIAGVSAVARGLSRGVSFAACAW